MGVDIDTYRARIGGFNARCTKSVCSVVAFSIRCVFTIGALVFICILLMMAGIEVNPGPKEMDWSLTISEYSEMFLDVIGSVCTTEVIVSLICIFVVTCAICICKKTKLTKNVTESPPITSPSDIQILPNEEIPESSMTVHDSRKAAARGAVPMVPVLRDHRTPGGDDQIMAQNMDEPSTSHKPTTSTMHNANISTQPKITVSCLTDNVLSSIAKCLSTEEDVKDVARNLDLTDNQITAEFTDGRAGINMVAFELLKKWRNKMAMKKVDEKIEELRKTLEKCGRNDIIRDILCAVDSVKVEVSKKSSIYDEMIKIVTTSLKNHYYKRIKVNPIPWCTDLALNMASLFTNLEIIHTGSRVELDDLFKPSPDDKRKQPPRRVLVHGAPGIGKTTLCRKLAYDWSEGKEYLAQFSMLFLLEARHIEGNIKDEVFRQLLPKDIDIDRTVLIEYWRKKPELILIIIDGYDELSHNVQSDMSEIIESRLMVPATVFISSRSYSTNSIKKDCQRVLSNKGFTLKNAKSYIAKHPFKKGVQYKGLVDAIHENKNVEELITNPLNVVLLCVVWEDNQNKLPESKTELYIDIVICILKRYCVKNGIEVDGYKIERKSIIQSFHEHCKIAFQLLSDKSMFTKKDIDKLIQKAIALSLGFLNEETTISRTEHAKYYTFPHKSIQEFLAAIHIVNNLECLDSITLKCHRVACVFAAGLVHHTITKGRDTKLGSICMAVSYDDFISSVMKPLIEQEGNDGWNGWYGSGYGYPFFIEYCDEFCWNKVECGKIATYWMQQAKSHLELHDAGACKLLKLVSLCDMSVLNNITNLSLQARDIDVSVKNIFDPILSAKKNNCLMKIKLSSYVKVICNLLPNFPNSLVSLTLEGIVCFPNKDYCKVLETLINLEQLHVTARQEDVSEICQSLCHLKSLCYICIDVVVNKPNNIDFTIIEQAIVLFGEEHCITKFQMKFICSDTTRNDLIIMLGEFCLLSTEIGSVTYELKCPYRGTNDLSVNDWRNLISHVCSLLNNNDGVTDIKLHFSTVIFSMIEPSTSTILSTKHTVEQLKTRNTHNVQNVCNNESKFPLAKYILDDDIATETLFMNILVEIGNTHNVELMLKDLCTFPKNGIQVVIRSGMLYTPYPLISAIVMFTCPDIEIHIEGLRTCICISTLEDVKDRFCYSKHKNLSLHESVVVKEGRVVQRGCCLCEGECKLSDKHYILGLNVLEIASYCTSTDKTFYINTLFE